MSVPEPSPISTSPAVMPCCNFAAPSKPWIVTSSPCFAMMPVSTPTLIGTNAKEVGKALPTTSLSVAAAGSAHPSPSKAVTTIAMRMALRTRINSSPPASSAATTVASLLAGASPTGGAAYQSSIVVSGRRAALSADARLFATRRRHGVDAVAKRQVDAEARAGARPACDDTSALIGDHDAAHDGKAEARAAASAFFRRKEGLEDT